MVQESKKVEEYIKNARLALEQNGWSIDERMADDGQCYLILRRDNERKAWGLFDRFYCYSLAVEALNLTPNLINGEHHGA